MAIHRPHPIEGEEQAWLYDDCDRCTEHALYLTAMDRDHCTGLLMMLLNDDRPRSETEGVALRKVESALILASQADPVVTLALLAKFAKEYEHIV